MAELRSYRKPDVPRDIAVQIASAVRFVWPGLLGKGPLLWESTPYPESGTHFVLIDGDVLLSHALATSRPLEHSGERFNVYGLSSVFCYPSHRGQGFGEQVVAGATEHIKRQSDADFALLFCGQRVQSLYLRQGWGIVPSLTVTFGDGQVFSDGIVLGLFVSDRARTHDFSSAPLHVGRATW